MCNLAIDPEMGQIKISKTMFIFFSPLKNGGKIMKCFSIDKRPNQLIIPDAAYMFCKRLLVDKLEMTFLSPSRARCSQVQLSYKTMLFIFGSVNKQSNETRSLIFRCRKFFLLCTFDLVLQGTGASRRL